MFKNPRSAILLQARTRAKNKRIKNEQFLKCQEFYRCRYLKGHFRYLPLKLQIKQVKISMQNQTKITQNASQLNKELDR